MHIIFRIYLILITIYVHISWKAKNEITPFTKENSYNQHCAKNIYNFLKYAATAIITISLSPLALSFGRDTALTINLVYFVFSFAQDNEYGSFSLQ